MLSKFIISAVILSFAIHICRAIGRDQSAGAEGYLLCGGEPIKDVKVKLYDKDTFDPDDLLDEGVTDSRGYFRLAGTTDEFSTIDPVLNIYHDCNDGIKPCQRKIKIEIPDKYVSSGKTPRILYNAGTLELEGEYKGEERDCIHFIA